MSAHESGVQQPGWVTAAWHIGHPVTRDVLVSALKRIAARHEAMRLDCSHDSIEILTPGSRDDMIEVTGHDSAEAPGLEVAQVAARTINNILGAGFEALNRPPVRLTVVALGSLHDGYLLVLVANEGVFDHDSIALFERELAAECAATPGSGSADAPEPPKPYSEFLKWERDVGEAELTAAMDTWSAILDKGFPAFELPTDKVRPVLRSGRAVAVRFEFPRDHVERLRAVGKSLGASLDSVMRAGFTALLARYSAQEDIVIAHPSSVRSELGFERTIGCFEDLVPLWTSLADEPTFSELVRRQSSQLTSLLVHRRVTLPCIVDSLSAGSKTVMSMPDVLFRFNRFPPTTGCARGSNVLRVKLGDVPRSHELALELDDVGDDLSGTLLYSPDLFDRDSVLRMSTHLVRLLEDAAEDPECLVSQLSLLSKEEHQKITVQWNQTETEFPKDTCLHELFEARVVGHEAGTAVVCGARHLTYGQLNEQSNRLAHRLRELGVGPDVAVGISMERSVDMVVALLAITKAGGAYVPIDPTYPEERIDFMLQDSGVRIVLTQDQLAARLLPYGKELLCVDSLTLEKSVENLSDTGVEPHHLAYVIVWGQIIVDRLRV